MKSLSVQSRNALYMSCDNDNIGNIHNAVVINVGTYFFCIVQRSNALNAEAVREIPVTFTEYYVGNGQE